VNSASGATAAYTVGASYTSPAGYFVCASAIAKVGLKRGRMPPQVKREVSILLDASLCS